VAAAIFLIAVAVVSAGRSAHVPPTSQASKFALPDVFADVGLATCVANEIDQQGLPAKASGPDLAQVQSLSCHGDLTGMRIRSLDGLAELPNLTSLDLPNNDVSDNQIAGIDPLGGLTGLGRLTITRNAITSPTPLGALPALTMLNIAGNRITDARTFVGFGALTELWVGGNPLSDLSPLAALPELLGVDTEGIDPTTMKGADVLEAHNIYVGGRA
jgi:hypothetical protein